MRASLLHDIRSLWSVPGYSLFIAFKAIAMASAWINLTVLMPVLVFRFGASPAQVALITAFSGAPYIFLVPQLGAMADRRSPITLMLGGSLFRAATLTGLAFAPTLEIFGLLMVANAAGSSASVADAVFLKRLLNDKQIAAANNVRNMLDQSLRMVAPAIGAGLMLAGSGQTAFLFTAVLAVASTGCVMALGRRTGMLHPATATRPPAVANKVRVLKELLASHASLKATVLLTIGCCTTMGMHSAVLIYLLHEQSLPAIAYQFHMTCTAIGGIAASLYFRSWIVEHDPVRILFWCAVGFFTCILVTGAWGMSHIPIQLTPLSAIWIASGFFFGGNVICYMTILQTRSPAGQVGLITASMQSLIMLTLELSPVIGLMVAQWRTAALAYVVSAMLGLLMLVPRAARVPVAPRNER